MSCRIGPTFLWTPRDTALFAEVPAAFDASPFGQHYGEAFHLALALRGRRVCGQLYPYQGSRLLLCSRVLVLELTLPVIVEGRDGDPLLLAILPPG